MTDGFPGLWATTISVPPERLVHRTSWVCPGYIPLSRQLPRTRTALPVRTENSVNARSDVSGRLVSDTVAQTILVPSGVMRALKPSMTLTALPCTNRRLSCSPFHCTTSLLFEGKLSPGAAVSRRRTSMLLPAHCWNASVLSSAAQDSTLPLPPALLVMGPPPGQVHARSAPVARVNTWIAGPGPPPRPPRNAMASLLPSGDRAMPEICACAGSGGMGNGVSGAG